MVHRLGGNVRTGRDQMQSHAEGRTSLGAVFKLDAGLVDLPHHPQGVQLFFQERGEGGGGAMMKVPEVDSHR